MKGRILEISDCLRNNKIDEIEARKLLLGLFDVSNRRGLLNSFLDW